MLVSFIYLEYEGCIVAAKTAFAAAHQLDILSRFSDPFCNGLAHFLGLLVSNNFKLVEALDTLKLQASSVKMAPLAKLEAVVNVFHSIHSWISLVEMQGLIPVIGKVWVDVIDDFFGQHGASILSNHDSVSMQSFLQLESQIKADGFVGSDYLSRVDAFFADLPSKLAKQQCDALLHQGLGLIRQQSFDTQFYSIPSKGINVFPLSAVHSKTLGLLTLLQDVITGLLDSSSIMYNRFI